MRKTQSPFPGHDINKHAKDSVESCMFGVSLEPRTYACAIQAARMSTRHNLQPYILAVGDKDIFFHWDLFFW
jgi:hypothetical protein